MAKPVDRNRYKSSSQSRYCSRNRKVEAQKWSIIPNSISVNKDQFSALINDGTFNNNLDIIVSYVECGALRVRIEPNSKESFKRYDCSKEETIINQKKLSSLSPISHEKNQTHSIIRSQKTTVEICYNPFSATIYDESGKVMVLNPQDTAIFETNRNKEALPQLFENSEFGGHNDAYKNGPTSVAMDVAFFGNQNRLTGLPGHTLPLSLPTTTNEGGEPIRFFNTDINHFEVNNGMSMYGAVPFILAHSLERSSGFFWLNPSETWVDITQQESSSLARFVSEGGYIDLFVFTGTNDQIMDSYTGLTGKPMLVPKFGLGYHQCRWGYMTSDELLEVSSNLDKYLVPHDVLWLDLDHTDDRKYFTFHPTNFPNPKKMLEEFAKFKRNVVVLVDPHLRAERSYPVYAAASDKKYLLKNKDGSEYIGNCWPGRSAWPDFLNPAVRAWWETLFDFSHYKQSAPNCHIWNDMNEISVFDSADGTCPRDLLHFDDIEEREVHNIYGHMMISATFGGLVKRSENQNSRPFILTRSFFAGSQKYSTVWSGDNAADWNHLSNSLQMVLSFGIGSIVYSGSDVGGFFDSPNPKLLSRWFSVGAWTYSFFREHCHHLAERREISVVSDDNARNLMRDSVVERYQMLPYWYTLSRESNLTGLPIVRPLWWEFNEARFLDIDDKAMLGRWLLIVPFMKETDEDISVPLPQGRWYSFREFNEVTGTETLAKFNGGKTAVFLRGGGVIPMKLRLRKSSALMFWDPYTLIVALDQNGNAEGELYEDDGETFNFNQGHYIHKVIKYNKNVLSSINKFEATQNQFTDKYDVEIELIKIVGLKSAPHKITCENGNNVRFEVINGVVHINQPKLLIRDNWNLVFTF